MNIRHFWLWALMACALAPRTAAAEKPAAPIYPAAICPFQERGAEVKGLGAQATDLLFAQLVADPALYLVEREELKKSLDELELSRSGLINPAQAVDVGRLTGAKILVTGSVLQTGEQLYLIAKVIGVETSRVLGSSVKGKVADDLGGLVESLAREVAKTIQDRAAELVGTSVSRDDRLAALQEKMGRGRRPAVWIECTERHVGQPAVDPAAETEVALFCRELGFDVIDRRQGSKSQADLLLIGEGFSEFAGRHGSLVSVKARLELKAIERESGRVLAVDRQTTVAVDLSEMIAGKSALQEAGATLAIRVLPKLVETPAAKPKKGK